MIEVQNRIIYENLPFEEYLKLPGYSFSTIKADKQIIAKTPKMNLGSNVDSYLNPPGNFDGNINIVKPIALCLKNRVGDLYYKFKKQVSITADFIHEDMRMKYKGRLDWGLERMIVIDIKVSENIFSTINYFGYPNQISGYCLGFECNTGLILSAHPKTYQTNLINITLNYDWWERQILKYGDINF